MKVQIDIISFIDNLVKDPNYGSEIRSEWINYKKQIKDGKMKFVSQEDQD